MSEETSKPVVAELRAEGILSHISSEDLETLKFYGVFGEYGPGEIVVHEGSDQNRLYVIIAGSLEVLIHSGGEDIVLGSIGAGDCIGEISIFEPGKASATVRVVETAVLWYLDVNSLQSFFEQMPVAGGQLMLGIAQLLTKRLRQANQAIVANRLLPKYLSVRSGKMQPITAQNLGVDEKKEQSGLLGGLFKGKKQPQAPKISTEIKIKPKSDKKE
ncbi:MAG: Crp/Fnr family transcriptional regulator [Verrucomicrobiota bacterium]